MTKMRLPNIKDIVRDAKDKRARNEIAAAKRPDELTRLNSEVARLRLERDRIVDRLPGDARQFIKDVTLFLQSPGKHNEDSFSRMFHRAYRLYIRYDVEEEPESEVNDGN